MTTIKKLSISGIRSFSDQTVETIEFFKPLTIIVGANGTGKTTIIEALKYICTGAQPPLSEGGKSFVHDPKISGSHLVKAQIKLGFRTADRRPVLAIRSFQVAVAKSKRTYKHLESVLRTVGADGREISISHVCANMEKQVPLLMGVSAAVLENVIFCHQEDSNWPLGESRLLKLRFDDIFAATRYTKALEVIRKERLDRMKLCTQMKADLTVLQNDMASAHKLEDDLAVSEASLKENEAKLRELDRVRAEMLQHLEAHQAKRNAVVRLQRDQHELQTKLNMMNAEAKAAYEALKTEYPEGLDSLRDFLNTAADKITAAEQQVSNFHQRARVAREQTQRLKEEHRQLVLNIGRMDAEIDGNRKRRLRIGMLIQELCEVMPELPAPPGAGEGENRAANLPADALAAFETTLKEQLLEKQRAQKTASRAWSNQDRELETNVANAKIELGNVQTELSLRQKQVAKLEQEHAAASLARPRGEPLDVAARHAAVMAAKAALDAFIAEGGEEQLRTDLDAVNRQRQVFTVKRAALVKERATLMHQKEAIQRLSYQREQLAKLQREGEAARDNVVASCGAWHDDPAGAVLAQLGASALRDAIVGAVQEQRAACRRDKDALAEARSELVAKKSEAATLARQLGAAEQAWEGAKRALSNFAFPAADGEQKMDPLAEGFDLQEDIDRMNKALNKLKVRKQIVTGARRMYKRFIEEAEDSNMCSLCDRDLDATELDHFLEVNKEKLDSAEQARKVAELESRVQAMTARRDQWVEGLPLWAAFQRTSAALPPLREQHDKQEGDAGLEDAVRVANETMVNAEAKLEKMEESASAAETASRLAREAEVLDGKIEREQRESMGSQNMGSQNAAGDPRTFEDCEKELEECDKERAALSTRHDACMKRRDVLMTERHALSESVAKAQREEAQARHEDADRHRQAAELKRIGTAMTVARSDIAQLTVRLTPVTKRVQELTAQRQAARTAYSERNLAFVKTIENVRRRQQDLSSLLAPLIAYEAPTAVADREKRHTLVREQEAQLNRLRQELAAAEKGLDESKAQVQKFIASRVDVELNIAYRERQATRDACQGELNALNAQLETKCAERRGEIGAQSKQVTRLRQDLTDDRFDDIDTRFRAKLVELQTNQMAAGDLDTYYKALDKALLQYHALKMKEINETLKDLWRTTYRGRDIDEVYIRTEQTVIKSSRRNYNYRVVMKQGDNELDMRGRCSAGQKVLACLLIRLALAETFCVQCGVLALDEPTTNLDARNIKSLAKSLANIIEKRRHQRNFQLIIITHDEVFVNEIGKRALCDYYFRTLKDDNNKSRIVKRRINE